MKVHPVASALPQDRLRDSEAYDLDGGVESVRGTRISDRHTRHQPVVSAIRVFRQERSRARHLVHFQVAPVDGRLDLQEECALYRINSDIPEEGPHQISPDVIQCGCFRGPRCMHVRERFLVMG